MPQSLQCPRCNGSVKIADGAAGQRVKCPHCQQTFLAPGIATTHKSTDEDDWLKLDKIPDVTAASPKPTIAPIAKAGGVPRKTNTDPPAKASGGSGKSFSPEDAALLAEFTSELDELTAELQTPPTANVVRSPNPTGGTERTGASPARPSAPGSEQKPVPAPTPAAEPVQYASEYRVTCNICGSILYAKASQAGKTVNCSDCHSTVTVPPPPKVSKKFQVNLDEAETFTFEPNSIAERRPDPYQKSADQLLKEAAQVEVASARVIDDDTPNLMEWLKGIVSPFKDVGVLAHMLGLTVLACVPTAIALTLDSPILLMGLFPGGIFLGLLTVSCGLAVLQAAANEEPRVSDWPTLDPFAWLGQLFLVAAAALVAALPVWILCMMTLGPQLLSVAITMFSIYVFFPFILLSMLDMGSPFVPFSSEVARSVTKCEEAWGGFYFSSGLMFVGLFLLFSTTSMTSPIAGAMISIVAAITTAFMYFAMIGRLAYAIGQAVNAPPRHDQVDRTRHTDIA